VIEWKEWLGSAANVLLGPVGTWAWTNARENVVPALCDARAKFLLDLALAIHHVQVESGNLKVFIGLDSPDDHFGTAFSVHGDSVEDIAFKPMWTNRRTSSQGDGMRSLEN
jgi:hypothetical protein